MNMYPDLSPEGLRGRKTAQATITAFLSGNSDEATQILAEFVYEGDVAAMSSYAIFTTGFLTARIESLAQDFGFDPTYGLAQAFLDLESSE